MAGVDGKADLDERHAHAGTTLQPFGDRQSLAAQELGIEQLALVSGSIVAEDCHDRLPRPDRPDEPPSTSPACSSISKHSGIASSSGIWNATSMGASTRLAVMRPCPMPSVM